MTVAIGALAGQVASSALWTYASYAVGRLLVFGGLVAMARLLQPDDFGLFGMATVPIGWLGVSYGFGLGRGLIYFGEREDASRLLEVGFSLSLGVGLFLSGLLFVAAPLVALFYGDPRVTPLMQVLAAYFGIACLGLVPDAILQRRLAFGRRFWPSIASPAGRYALGIILAARGFGVWSLVWGQLVGIALEVLGLFLLAGWRPRVRWSLASARKLVSYASQVSAIEWLAALVLNLDYLLVGRFLGSSALGVYTLAFKLPDTTIGAVGEVASRVLLPAFVRFGDDRATLRDALLQSLRFLLLVLTPAAAGLSVLAPSLVPLVFGEQWIDAVPVVQLLAISSCLNGILHGVGAGLLAAGQPRRIIVAQIAWIAVLVPALYVASQVSIVAVGVAHVLGILVFAAVKLALVSPLLGIRGRDLVRIAAPGLLATTSMVLVLVPTLQAIASVPAAVLAGVGVVEGAAVYVAALWMLDASAVRLIWALVAPATGRPQAGPA